MLATQEMSSRGGSKHLSSKTRCSCYRRQVAGPAAAATAAVAAAKEAHKSCQIATRLASQAAAPAALSALLSSSLPPPPPPLAARVLALGCEYLSACNISETLAHDNQQEERITTPTDSAPRSHPQSPIHQQLPATGTCDCRSSLPPLSYLMMLQLYIPSFSLLIYLDIYLHHNLRAHEHPSNGQQVGQLLPPASPLITAKE